MSWQTVLTQTADTLSTREELLKSCKELLSTVKQFPMNPVRSLVAQRAQLVIEKAAKETGLVHIVDTWMPGDSK